MKQQVKERKQHLTCFSKVFNAWRSAFSFTKWYKNIENIAIVKLHSSFVVTAVIVVYSKKKKKFTANFSCLSVVLPLFHTLKLEFRKKNIP